jgi:hypothetical protein
LVRAVSASGGHETRRPDQGIRRARRIGGASDWCSVSAFILKKSVHRKGRQGREGKQSASLVIKITNLVVVSGFTLALIPLASFASLAVQMLDLGS